MTTKADERIARIEEAITRLEALGLAAPTPSPSSVNADGTPGHVAAGELIESAWGNAVVDTLLARTAYGAANPGQSWTTGQVFSMNWPQVAYDTHGFNPGGGNVITIPANQGGMYVITAYVLAAGPVTASSFVEIRVDSTVIANGLIPAGGTVTNVSTVAAINAGHTIEVSIYNGHGGSMSYSGRVSLARISP